MYIRDTLLLAAGETRMPPPSSSLAHISGIRGIASGRPSAAVPVTIVVGLVRVHRIRVDHSRRRRGWRICVGSGGGHQDTPTEKPSSQGKQCESHEGSSCVIDEGATAIYSSIRHEDVWRVG